jgi:hypothetical protein
MCRAYAFH